VSDLFVVSDSWRREHPGAAVGVLAAGADRVRPIAERTLADVQRKMGLR
jgi:hypothetical protein